MTYIIHVMNKFLPDQPPTPAGAFEQAQLLAGLTQELALCCLGKENEIFAQYGLSASQGHILLTLSEWGAVTPSHLAARQSVSRGRITPLVQSLVEAGFVNRSEARHDRRVRTLTLTSLGQRVANVAAGFRLEFHARLLERFPESDRQNLLSTLSLLHEHIHQLRDELKTQHRRLTVE
jgi:DNA-binding MarR family transcriptional regulator